MYRIIQIYKNNLFLIWIFFLGIFLRIYYLIRKSGELVVPNLGGDPCYHYNVALNIANGIGPKTSFIFSYWFYHPEIPAYTDLYGPGYAFFLSFFLLFDDNFFNLRLANFLIGILSILIAYFIGKKIHSKNVGLLSAFFISINFFHIENSTVVMREIFTLALTQVFFLILIYLDKKKLIFFFLIGLTTGYISITTGIWPLYILIFFLYSILILKSINYKTLIIFLSGFLVTSINWILITKSYFGKFYYSNLDFYPYVSNWSRMMIDKGLPEIDNFWSNIDLQEYLSQHFYWLLNNLYKGSLILSPTFVFFLFFLLIPLSIYGSIKLKKKGFIFIFFLILYFLGLSFASYALNGNLWPRHYLPMLGNITLLLSVGLMPLLAFINNKYLNVSNFKYFTVIFFISLFVTVIGIEKKTSYWEKNDKNFYEFGNKIKKVTNEDSVIMYTVAVPDVWCSTNRKVVHDVSRGAPIELGRIKSEITQYNITHIFVDLSSENYSFSKQKIKETLNNYKNIKLKKILEDRDNGYFFYQIFGN